MRLEKAAGLVDVARRLAASAEGMTLDDIAVAAGVDRRTAERMRDALRQLFPQMEELADGKQKRFRIPSGLDSFMQEPTPEELAELQVASSSLELAGGTDRAALLRTLGNKIQSALRTNIKRRLAADVEALSVATGSVMQAGPRPIVDPQTLVNIRLTIKGLRTCVFRYSSIAVPDGQVRIVIPYGLLFGRDYYLLGPEVGKQHPVLWRLDRVSELKPGEPCAGPPPTFDLGAYAAKSFGTFQEKPEDIVLRFLPKAASDARRYQFHPTQQTELASDGSLIVKFTAGGLQELVWHLFSWGDGVEIIAPDKLRTLMVESLNSTLQRHSTTENGISQS